MWERLQGAREFTTEKSAEHASTWEAILSALSSAILDAMLDNPRRVLRLALCAAVLGLALPLHAQQSVSILPDPGGDGSDGAFLASVGSFLDSDQQPVWNFTTFTVPAGVTLELRGSLPLEIRVQGVARIDGTLDASGRDGGDGANDAPGGLGGQPGPGGGPGGDGGASAATPFVGTGANGLRNGGEGGTDTGVPGGSFTDPVGGGGGGGNAAAGLEGGAANSGRAPSGSGLGAQANFRCFGGGGGGGGGGDIDSLNDARQNDGGGGGGGGGGRLLLVSSSVVQVAQGARVLANGGRGGSSSGNGGGGGGGAGGYLVFSAPFVVIDGEVLALAGQAGTATQTLAGAAPGGRGGVGCIHLNGSFIGSGFVFPEPDFRFFELEVSAYSGPQAVDVLLGDPAGSYATGLAVFQLSTPISLPGIGDLWLDPTDFLFRIVIGQPAFTNAFTGLVGGATGRIIISPPPLNPNSAGLDLVLYLQVFAFDGQGNWNGLSALLPVHFLF